MAATQAFLSLSVDNMFSSITRTRSASGAGMLSLPHEVLGTVLVSLKNRGSRADFATFSLTCKRFHAVSLPTAHKLHVVRLALRGGSASGAMSAGIEHDQGDRRLCWLELLAQSTRNVQPKLGLPEDAWLLGLSEWPELMQCLPQEAVIDLSIRTQLPPLERDRAGLQDLLDHMATCLLNSCSGLSQQQAAQALQVVLRAGKTGPFFGQELIAQLRHTQLRDALDLLAQLFKTTKTSDLGWQSRDMVLAGVKRDLVFKHEAGGMLLYVVLFACQSQHQASHGFLTELMASDICPAIQRLARPEEWHSWDVWVPQLAAAISVATHLDESTRYKLLARIGIALDIGGWRHMKEAEWEQLLQLLQQHGIQGLRAWLKQMRAG